MVRIGSGFYNIFIKLFKIMPANSSSQISSPYSLIVKRVSSTASTKYFLILHTATACAILKRTFTNNSNIQSSNRYYGKLQKHHLSQNSIKRCKKWAKSILEHQCGS